MRKSLTRVLLGTTLAGIALLSLSAASWSAGHGGMDRDPGRMIAHMTDRLDLSEEQRSQAEQILGSAGEQTAQYREELDSLREQLRAMRGNFDPDTARSISDRIGTITGKMLFVVASSQSELYAMLTPEQRTQMDEFMAKRDERRGKWHKRDRKEPTEE